MSLLSASLQALESLRRDFGVLLLVTNEGEVRSCLVVPLMVH